MLEECQIGCYINLNDDAEYLKLIQINCSMLLGSYKLHVCNPLKGGGILYISLNLNFKQHPKCLNKNWVL